MSEPTRIVLEADEIPTHWYNVVADLSTPPAPPLGADGKPATAEQMQAIFPDRIIEQEMSAERWIEIPDEVREIYKIWRPESADAGGAPGACARYPGEDLHNTRASPGRIAQTHLAVPQAFYNRQAGIKRLTTETGAGQWGSSIAFAGQMFGLEVRVYMVKVSYQQNPTGAS